MPNKGFQTEQDHYASLSELFDWVSVPKFSGGGSDFQVVSDSKIVTFESKSSNNDIFDAGVISIFSNGCIFNASNFLSNTHVSQLQTLIQANISQVIDYTKAANTNTIPHMTTKDRFNDIKADNKLIHIRSPEPLNNIIEASFVKSSNEFVKANYIVIDKNVYCISDRPELDPLGLQSYGAAILDDSCISYTTVRCGRTGSGRTGRVSVNVRVQYRLNKILPETKVKL